MVIRTATGLPPAPLRTPMSAETFAEHFPLAVAAGEPLALIVLRGDGALRARERVERALCEAPGFAYQLQPGGYALLLPGATAAEALQQAFSIRTALRGALLRPGTLLDAGVATLGPGMGPQELFAAAAGALADAALTGCGAMLGRAPAHA
jgi:hypothetical protein